MRVAGNPKALLTRPAIKSEFQCDRCGFIGEVTYFFETGLCMDCHNRERDLFRKPRDGGASKQQKFERAMKALQLTATHKTVKAKANSVENLVNHMMNQFGSMEEFTRVWSESIKCSFAKDPASWKGMRAMEQVAKLIVDCNRLNPPATSVDTMSDEELETEMVAIISARVRNNEISIAKLAQMVDEATEYQQQVVEGEVRK